MSHNPDDCRSSSLRQLGWCERKRNPLAVAPDGLAERELEAAAVAREIEATVAFVEVCALDKKPVYGIARYNKADVRRERK